jgi:hypothetical protein
MGNGFSSPGFPHSGFPLTSQRIAVLLTVSGGWQTLEQLAKTASISMADEVIRDRLLAIIHEMQRAGVVRLEENSESVAASRVALEPLVLIPRSTLDAMATALAQTSDEATGSYQELVASLHAALSILAPFQPQPTR